MTAAILIAATTNRSYSIEGTETYNQTLRKIHQ
jgi:hypothetical protein